MNYAFLGLGFIQGWLWLFFLNGPLLFSKVEGWSITNEMILLTFLLANSLTYFWITKKSFGSSPLYSRNLILVISALLMTTSVLMVKFTAGQIGVIEYVGLAFLGTVIAGFGSSILIVALGELFSLVPVTMAGLSFACSVTIGTVLFFGALKLTIFAAFLLLALCPVIALPFIFLGRRQISKTNLSVVKSPQTSLPFPFPRKLTILIILFNLTGGLFYKIILISSVSALQETYWITNVIYCLVIIVAGSCLYGFSDLDMSVLYRPVLPLLGAGFVLISYFHEIIVFLPLSLLQAGFALFDLYTWLLFAYIAKSYQRPAFIFGWGMLLITGSIFFGETLFATLFAKLTFSIEEIEILSTCAALLMMAGTILFQGKRDSFAGWEQILTAEMACTLECETDDIDEIEGGIKCESVCGQTEERRNIGDLRKQFLLILGLTKREKDVALLLFEGRNNPYIRECLNISNNTLKTHLRNIYRKGMVNDRQKFLDLFDKFESESEKG